MFWRGLNLHLPRHTITSNLREGMRPPAAPKWSENIFQMILNSCDLGTCDLSSCDTCDLSTSFCSAGNFCTVLKGHEE